MAFPHFNERSWGPNEEVSSRWFMCIRPRPSAAAAALPRSGCPKLTCRQAVGHMMHRADTRCQVLPPLTDVLFSLQTGISFWKKSSGDRGIKLTHADTETKV